MRYESFGHMLADLLHERGWSQAEYARKTGANQSFVSQVVRGVRKPPLRRLDAWATELGLAGTQLRQFIELGHLGHTSPVVREMVERLVRTSARKAKPPNSDG
jgi:transcriptional regulator with XRE-family HTH domain